MMRLSDLTDEQRDGLMEVAGNMAGLTGKPGEVKPCWARLTDDLIVPVAVTADIGSGVLAIDCIDRPQDVPMLCNEKLALIPGTAAHGLRWAMWAQASIDPVCYYEFTTDRAWNIVVEVLEARGLALVPIHDRRLYVVTRAFELLA